MAMTSVRMPEDLMVRLEAASEKLRRSKGWVINEALNEYLNKEEARARLLEETRQALSQVEAGQVVDGDAVLEWIESWGTSNEKTPPAEDLNA